MKLQSKTIGTVAATMLLALALAACGGATTSTSPTAATASTAAPAAQATSAPAEQDTSAPATGATAESATSAPATEATAAPAATAAAEQPTASAGQAAPAMTKLNLNEVTEDQLTSTIPNFSGRMVREFFEYRPYISIQQFRREIGKYVSAEEVAAYEQFVYVPIDVDQADADTLQQVPGIDASIADQLIAGRPYGSNEAFLAKLAELAPTVDATQAAAYLAS
jgi:DNA uptake protein ComE-like DNA-binding protein